MLNAQRKYFTSAVGFTFFVVGLSGVIFKFFSKNHTLVEIHGWIGLAMVGVAIVHIIHNWKPLMHHFTDSRVFILLIPLVLVMGAIAFGDNGPNNNRNAGNINPREVMHRLTTASVGDVAHVFGKDPDAVLAAMRKDGLSVATSSQTLEQLSETNRKSPEGVLAYFVSR